MDSSIWTTKKSTKPPKVARDENFNREGRWTRRFYVRSDLWPVVEHWATENEYLMTAARGQSRRLYQKDGAVGFFTTFIDIKIIGSEAVITAWIEVGFKARLLSFFTLPRELKVNPHGLKGASQRRPLVHSLNVLLERLRQPLIFGSRGFHVADLDLTARLLVVALSSLTITFLALGISRLEVRPGLSTTLLITFSKNFGYLLGLGLLLLCIHQFGILKATPERLYRFISAGVMVTLHAALAVLLFTHTADDLIVERISFYCLQSFKEPACERVLIELKRKDKERVLDHLRLMEQELTRLR